MLILSFFPPSAILDPPKRTLNLLELFPTYPYLSIFPSHEYICEPARRLLSFFSTEVPSAPINGIGFVKTFPRFSAKVKPFSLSLKSVAVPFKPNCEPNLYVVYQAAPIGVLETIFPTESIA
jgi:hypothetical protein